MSILLSVIGCSPNNAGMGLSGMIGAVYVPDMLPSYAVGTVTEVLQ